MPIVTLSAGFVRQAICVAARKKTDYFDLTQRGFLLEVRQSGGKNATPTNVGVSASIKSGRPRF